MSKKAKTPEQQILEQLTDLSKGTDDVTSAIVDRLDSIDTRLNRIEVQLGLASNGGEEEEEEEDDDEEAFRAEPIDLLKRHNENYWVIAEVESDPPDYFAGFGGTTPDWTEDIKEAIHIKGRNKAAQRANELMKLMGWQTQLSIEKHNI